jgi:hypothetical protein
MHYTNYEIEYIFSQYQVLLELLLMNLCNVYIAVLPVPVVAPSKAYVCGRSPAEMMGSNLTGGMDVCML